LSSHLPTSCLFLRAHSNTCSIDLLYTGAKHTVLEVYVTDKSVEILYFPVFVHHFSPGNRYHKRFLSFFIDV